MDDNLDLFREGLPIDHIRRQHMARVRATITGSERAICPCCNRLDKMYKRLFGLHQAYSVAWLAGNTEVGQYLHVDKMPFRMVKDPCWRWAKHWGFLVEQPNDDDPSKKDSGHWSLTDAGRLFVRGRTTIWSHALIYHKELLEFVGREGVRFSDCVGAFHYQKMMNGEW